MSRITTFHCNCCGVLIGESDNNYYHEGATLEYCEPPSISNMKEKLDYCTHCWELVIAKIKEVGDEQQR